MSDSSRERGLYAFGDWQLTPEGAAIHMKEQTAVIADVHLGYEWARGAAGDCVIAHSIDETLARLALVLERAPVARLVVAGDLVESPRPCPQTRADIHRLGAWLSVRGVALVALAGNHDLDLFSRSDGDWAAVRSMPAICQLGRWTISHGHLPIPGECTVSGHHHPVLQVEGTTALCFLVGPGRIILPAFTSNAAGCDVGGSAVPDQWLKVRLRCVASTGEELLDFGPLTELRRRLRRRKSRRRLRASP
jgi:putative SbcD/Mre11-related phosphoesterase